MPEGYSVGPEWANYLRLRGVTPKAASARGYREVLQGKDLDGRFAKTYGFPPKAAGLLIPLHGLLGGDQTYQLRLTDPDSIRDKKGKPLKFLSPKGQPNVLVTSPLTRAKLTEAKQLIVIAEGATRVDALAGYDVPAVGLTGINNWRGGNPSRALPDFNELGIKGNRFLLAADGDVRTNPKVNEAIGELKRFLEGKGADRVLVLLLPAGMGLDDWINASQFSDTDALMAAMLDRVTATLQPAIPTAVDQDGMFSVDNASPWACTPVADVRRLLEHEPGRLALVRPELVTDKRAQSSPWRIMVEVEGGRWTLDDATIGRMHIEAALAWQKRVTKAVMEQQLRGDQAANCARWAVQSAKPSGLQNMLASIGPAAELMLKHGLMPPEVVICRESELDQGAALGAPNGVICLDSGTLLPRTEARKKLVTRSVPDPFNADAKHQYADELLAHLGADERRWILEAVGFALRGVVARRLYALCGPTGGGKTTLLSALHHALGDVHAGGYAMKMMIGALCKSRFRSPTDHSGGVFGLQDCRVAYAEEPPEGAKLDGQVLKDYSGGGGGALRNVGEKPGANRPITATMFFAFNPGQEDALDTSEGALKDRARLLKYPQLPKADPLREFDMRDQAEVRQAVLRMIVTAAKENPLPPGDIQSVAEYREERYNDSLGEVGLWIKGHLVAAGTRDRAGLKQTWEAIVEDLGPADKHGRVAGCSYDDMKKLARTVHPKLPRAVSGGKAVGNVWKGWRLLSADEVEPEDDDQDATLPKCAICGKSAQNPRIDRGQPVCRDCYPDDVDPPPTGGPGLSEAIDAAESQLVHERQAQLEAHMARGTPSEGLLQAAKYNSALRGLRAFRDADPAGVLAQRHVDALGGAEALVSRLVQTAARVMPRSLERVDWLAVCWGLRKMVETDLQRSVERRQDQLVPWLLSALTQPALQKEGA